MRCDLGALLGADAFQPLVGQVAEQPEEVRAGDEQQADQDNERREQHPAGVLQLTADREERAPPASTSATPAAKRSHPLGESLVAARRQRRRCSSSASRHSRTTPSPAIASGQNSVPPMPKPSTRASSSAPTVRATRAISWPTSRPRPATAGDAAAFEPPALEPVARRARRRRTS